MRGIFKILLRPTVGLQTNPKAFIKFILPFLYFLKANSRKSQTSLEALFLASFLLLQKHFNCILEKCQNNMGTS
jgi:hypothetical protein